MLEGDESGGLDVSDSLEGGERLSLIAIEDLS